MLSVTITVEKAVSTVLPLFTISAGKPSSVGAPFSRTPRVSPSLHIAPAEQRLSGNALIVGTISKTTARFEP